MSAQNSSTNGRVTYASCIEYQQRLHDRINQMEQRLSDKIDQLRVKVYTTAGIVAVLLSLIINFIFKA